MASRWQVRFTDDDEDGVQTASFNTQKDAQLWIDNQEMQNRYDNMHFEVVDGPYETSSQMLTEGKHWPEDYIKTAVNLVKQSPIGQQSWYTDQFISQDIKTFADEFAPLSHKSSNLGFFMAIVRWFIEYSGTSAQKYQEFIERKLDDIIAALLKIRNDKAYDSRADEIKKMTYQQFMKLADEVNAKASDDDIAVASSDIVYEVVPIYSYEELHKKYGGPLTGYKGDSEWCYTNGQSTYDSWTKDGTQMFFVIQRKDWKDVNAPNQKPETCYDEYGMSLIAILVNVATNKLLNSTSRWNHIILPKSGAADTMFESWSQLNKAVRLDVEEFCLDECKELREKLQQKSVKANEAVAKILKNAKIITDVTIPKELRNAVTEVSIPFGVESINTHAFAGCTSLKSITIPNSVKRIGYWAFYYCTALKSIIISDSVESIENSTFENCISLKSITIPDSVESIGEWVFYSCISLKSITIPDSVESIGYKAFYNCTSLKEVIFKRKTIDQVKAMDNYPWGIKDVSVIKCENLLDESNFAYCHGTKIWVDDARPAPEGYVWLKSVNEFIDYMVEHGIYDISVFDFDHDAGDYASDGGDYIKCLDWLEAIGADNINVRVHSANPVGAAKMRQIISKNQWNEVFDVIDESLSIEEQIALLFESSSQAGCEFGETWDLLDSSSPAYSAIADSVSCIPSLRLSDVYKVEDSNRFIGVVHGGDNGSMDRQKWLRYLESVKKFIAQMFKHGCGDVWLVDFSNDCADDVFALRVGFNLLSSPFASDGNTLLDEDKKSKRSPSSGQEDAKAKGKVVNALKDASKEFQKMASNNDPQQFAKIVVAFDDLTAGVGAYDFKEKRKLEEDDEADGKDTAKDILAALMRKLSDAGAKCSTAQLQSDGIVKVNGEFNDRIPLDCLLFRWHFEDEYNPTGWYECTKCMNKWRGVGKEILDKLAPNGLDAMCLQEVEDGN